MPPLSALILLNSPRTWVKTEPSWDMTSSLSLRHSPFLTLSPSTLTRSSLPKVSCAPPWAPLGLEPLDQTGVPVGQQTLADLGRPGNGRSYFYLRPVPSWYKISQKGELHSPACLCHHGHHMCQRALLRLWFPNWKEASWGGHPVLPSGCLPPTNRGIDAPEHILSLPNCATSGSRSSPSVGSTLSLQQKASSPNERMDNRARKKWLTSMPTNKLFLHLMCCWLSTLCTNTVVLRPFTPAT